MLTFGLFFILCVSVYVVICLLECKSVLVSVQVLVFMSVHVMLVPVHVVEVMLLVSVVMVLMFVVKVVLVVWLVFLLLIVAVLCCLVTGTDTTMSVSAGVEFDFSAVMSLVMLI